MGWVRPSSSPRVWRDIELVNSAGKKLQFTIQEIPENRYDEALEHMCTIFVNDEPILSSMKISSDPDAILALKQFWKIPLKQGISIAAFATHSDSKKPELAGLNILTVIDDEFDNKLKSFDIQHVKIKKFINFMFNFNANGDSRLMYNVKLLLSAFGLSVHPKYRGFGLGKCLLETRNDIGQVYNISITETIFSSEIAQKIAIAVGFKEHLVRAYESIVDEDGEKLMLLLAGKQVKLMIKQLI